MAFVEDGHQFLQLGKALEQAGFTSTPKTTSIAVTDPAKNGLVISVNQPAQKVLMKTEVITLRIGVFEGGATPSGSVKPSVTPSTPG